MEIIHPSAPECSQVVRNRLVPRQRTLPRLLEQESCWKDGRGEKSQDVVDAGGGRGDQTFRHGGRGWRDLWGGDVEGVSLHIPMDSECFWSTVGRLEGHCGGRVSKVVGDEED